MCNCPCLTVLAYSNSSLVQTEIILLVFNSCVTRRRIPSGLKQQPSLISLCL